MTRKHFRIFSVILILTGFSISVALALYALRNNVSYFYSPSDLSQLALDEANLQARSFRLGGLVKEGSISTKGTFTTFTVSDNLEEVNVNYEGILPSLFREGQGVIAFGTYNQIDQIFYASEILAKHDENYMPPEVAKALEKGVYQSDY